jgi:hypothetical protein
MKYLPGDRLICNFASNRATVVVQSVNSTYLTAKYCGGKAVKINLTSVGSGLDYEFAGQSVDLSKVPEHAIKAASFYHGEITANGRDFPQTIRIANQLWHRKHPECSGYHYHCAVDGYSDTIAGMWIGLVEIRQHIASLVN